MLRLIAVAAGVVVLAGCAAPQTSTVTVLAAASLTDALDEASAAYRAEHPDVEIVVGYGGSSALAEQIVSGAPADVFFAANEATMQTVVDASLAVDPEVLLTNTLELVVPAGNPGEVRGLADLADPQLVVALCDPSVPCGAAAVQLLDLAGVTASVDTYEDDVRAALTKVALGEVDAALVYRTDVAAAGDAVEGIEIPEAASVVNRYPVALLADAADPAAAQEFLDFLRSAEGREVFERAGFVAP
ncbi:molybdate ABC transporter substrate-binding protein [Pseudolysinimonas yzui]|uniref:Molybdate-binding protein n=1 Tax=Pseudolysinimonas yzui TaxID=2708254 RepID=A0A8J3M170_9MICO|nr:molybdate ABC transporter substrate-binding protein [Pseudolysinimonas yzui]GHF16323.1 molybdate-binding protein [Pseudolysinimonas yzui]